MEKDISKRDVLISSVTTGLLANTELCDVTTFNAKTFARAVIAITDELIKAAEKKEDEDDKLD